MTMTWVTVLIGGLSGLAALLGVLLGRRQQIAVTDKTRAEAAAVIQDTALELLEPLRKELSAVRGELEEVRGEAAKLSVELRAERLWRQQSHELLVQRGIDPPPRPSGSHIA